MSLLDAQIDAIVNPDSSGYTGNSLIVLNHLTQMKMFGIREGVEFYPDQDDRRGSRKSFIDDVVRHNQLDIQQDRIWNLTLAKGQVLFYFRPSKKGIYDIHFYDKDSFRCYYNRDSEIEKAVIIFSYKEVGIAMAVPKDKWIKLTITTEFIDEEVYDQQPSFDSEFQSLNIKRYTNSLNFIPCEIAKNNPQGKGMDGVGEFEQFRSIIEEHTTAVEAFSENLQFFGNPILISSASPNEITEIVSDKSANLTQANTATANAGWYGVGQNSTRIGNPRHLTGGMYSNLRVKKVIGNISDQDRIAFITPDPTTPDHARYIQETREAIHFALGGIDETGIHANATAYEMKVVYGKVATTAKKKAEAIYTHCICRLLEKMIAAEEDLFRKSMALVLKKDITEITDNFINEYMTKNQGAIPNGVVGLPPMGKRTVRWRWTGPVFEDSPQDLQQKSIVVRNLQELGVRSLDALTFLFPEKTEKEKQGMLNGGYPFRYLNAIAGTTGQMLGLYQNMLQLPDQSNPQLPMSATIPIAPMIQKSLETIYTELNYEQPTEQLSISDVVYTTGGDAYEQYLNAVNSVDGTISPVTSARNNGSTAQLPKQLTGADYSVSTNPGIPVSPTPLQSSGIPLPNLYSPEYIAYLQRVNPQLLTRFGMEGGIPSSSQSTSIPPEYSAGLPYSGSSIQPQFNSSNPSGLPNAYNTSPLNPIPANIPPDLLTTADQPGSVWDQLFGSFTEWKQKQSDKSKSKSKSKSTTKGK